MIQKTLIPSNEIKEILYEGRAYSLFRIESKNQLRIAKVLHADRYSELDEAYLLREQQILEGLKCNGILPVLEIQSSSGIPVSIFENFDARNLFTVKKKSNFNILEFLKDAISISSIIKELHENNIVHKNLSPKTIFKSNDSDKFLVTDFCLASKHNTENNDLQGLITWHQSLQYISPEQTGRLNRIVDHRSDIYSLGLIFYFLLSGEDAFENRELNELIHSQLTKAPDIKFLQQNGVPEIICNIILKAVSKMPEERYQDVDSIIQDLQFCIDRIDNISELTSEFLSDHNEGSKFIESDKIYGKDVQLNSLLDAFEKVAESNSLTVLLHGNTGTGKSVLTKELHKVGLKRNAYYVNTKFDQFKKAVPLQALKIAISNLVRFLAGESESELNKIKADLVSHLGMNLSVMVELIPDLGKLIENVAEPVNLNIEASQNRVFFAFREFIKFFSTTDHPLILVLEDVQYCDEASAKLLYEIGGKIPHFLLVLSYQDEGIHLNAEVKELVEKLNKKDYTVDLYIENYSTVHIEKLVQDSFNFNSESTEKLTQLLLKRTDGNPDAVNNLLLSLFNSKYLYFDKVSKKWMIDETKTIHIESTVKFIELLENAWRDLSEDEKSLLQIASCIGLQFDLFSLCLYKRESAKKTLDLILPAIKNEIISPENDHYLLINAENDFGASFRFSNEKIFKVVLNSISEEERQKIHYELGKQKLKEFSGPHLDSKIIEIVSHLNVGMNVVKSGSERLKYARYNLVAGKKAQLAIAYQSAIEHFTKGIEFISGDCWKVDYSLSYELYSGLAQNAYQVGKLDLAESSVESLLKNAGSNIDYVKGLSIRLRQYTTLGKTEEAIQQGVKGLARLGIKISEKPGLLDVLKEVFKVKWKMRGRKVEDLLELPLMKDEESRLAARLLTEIGPAAYILGNDNLYGLSSLKVVNLSLDKGNCPESSFAYTAYGAVLGEAFKDYNSKEAFGKLAVDLNYKLNDREYRCRVIAAYGVLMLHVSKHWSKQEQWYKAGIEAGFESGDLFFLAYCAANAIIFNPVLPLSRVLQENRKYIKLTEDTRFVDAIDSTYLFNQAVNCYNGNTESPASLNSEFFNEEKYLNNLEKRKYFSGLGMYNIFKAEILYNNYQFEEALPFIKKSEKYLQSLIGLIVVTKLEIVTFVVYCELYNKQNFTTRILWKRKLNSILAKFKSLSEFNPTNHSHTYELMQAELNLLNNNESQALLHFERSIELAGTNEYFAQQGLSLERLASYYIKKSTPLLALPYLHAALKLYESLNYKTKEVLISSLIEKFSEKSSAAHLISSTSVKQNQTDEANVDLTSIVNASQTIAGEIRLESLLEKMIKIIMQNAGSEKAVLLILENHKLLPKAYAHEKGLEILEKIQTPFFELVPQTIINYVVNLKESIVLENASQKSNFINDPYIVKNNVRSILCTPIMHQGSLFGLIYLENNKIIGTFTENRMNIINLLSTQMAISLQNALLYSSLEEKVEVRTNELVKSYNKLQEAQDQLIHAEKMASLGELTAGIAHEIQNPLNFINNFSDINTEIIDEVIEKLKDVSVADLNMEEVNEDLTIIKDNSNKILTHGKRAESIVKGMLQHSRKGSDKKEETDVNLLVEEFTRLAFHGMRAKNKSFNANFKTELAQDLPKIVVLNQEIGRVILNIINNAFYAVEQKAKMGIPNYQALVTSRTFKDNQYLVVEIEDNGIGIPQHVQQKVFQPFYTTKPTGQGTGLGLSISYDIVTKAHNGILELSSIEHSEEFPLRSKTVFTIKLPLQSESNSN